MHTSIVIRHNFPNPVNLLTCMHEYERYIKAEKISRYSSLKSGILQDIYLLLLSNYGNIYVVSVCLFVRPNIDMF